MVDEVLFFFYFTCNDHNFVCMVGGGGFMDSVFELFAILLVEFMSARFSSSKCSY